MNTGQIDDIEAMRARIVELERALAGSRRLIDKLEDVIARLAQRHWGRSSERHPGQGELSLFNEAELVAMGGDDDEDEAAEEPSGADDAAGTGTGTGGADKPAKRRRRRVLPDHLERVAVRHELDETERRCRCGCGGSLVPIGEEITEQLGVMPATHFVIQHIKVKYACPCKGGGVRTAPMPAPLIPGSQASAALVAATMVGKLDWASPLYRQERIAKSFGVDLPRAKLARWMIAGAAHLTPLYNLMQDELFGHDIVQSDDTGIQVLKEDGRDPSSRSALWIRRGGPPGRAVVLVDYRPSKGLSEARSLLEHCREGSYLVCDAAATFLGVARIHALVPVLCNDHARRMFVDAARPTKKKPAPKGWIATKAIGFYKTLYEIERSAKPLSADQRRERRQARAAPVWDAFMAWAKRMHGEGVRDARTREALEYLIRHEEGLRRYLEDGRLPISNILSEHVAKTVAVARRNFLFADTPAGAAASAMVYSVIESAKANGRNVLKYLTVVLDEIPGARSVEEVEALLPWRLTDSEVEARYARLPWPSIAAPATTGAVEKPG